MRNSFGASKNMKRLKDGGKGKYHKRDQVASKLLLFGNFLLLFIEYCRALELFKQRSTKQKQTKTKNKAILFAVDLQQ